MAALSLPDLRQVFVLYSNAGVMPICHLQPEHSWCTLGLLVIFGSRDVSHLLQLEYTWTLQLERCKTVAFI